jgi:UDP-N-acetyl-2-amino-2-deoxyglucuronate dehydrogenase
MTRLGVIGCGAIHATHCEAINSIDGASLAAVYDEDSERAIAAGERFGVAPATSLDDLFDRVDAVNVCVPSGLHGQIGEIAARAGKHVLVEKPVEVTYEAARSLVDTCRAAGVNLGTISQHRFADDVRRLRDAAQGGELGPLIEGDMYNKWYRTQAYYDSGDWRGTWKLDGGGCLMNQGVHYVDLLQWIMGGVRSVQAQTRTVGHDIEVEDVATALVEFKNGAIGVIQGATAVYPGLAERIEIHGRYGTAILEADRLKYWNVDQEAAAEGLYGGGVNAQPTPNVQLHDPVDTEGTGASDPSAIWGHQHRMQIEDFVQSIVDCRPPAVTGEMAIEPLKVILAIYRSAREGGRRVEIA